MKIKKGDQVEIIAGKDRGKRGKVIQVLATVERVVVEGANLMKRHRKPRKEGEKGERIERPAHSMSPMSCLCVRRQGSQLELDIE